MSKQSYKQRIYLLLPTLVDKSVRIVYSSTLTMTHGKFFIYYFFQGVCSDQIFYSFYFSLPSSLLKLKKQKKYIGLMLFLMNGRRPVKKKLKYIKQKQKKKNKFLKSYSYLEKLKIKSCDKVL